MKRKFSKISSVLLGLLLVLTMAPTVYAAEHTVTNGSDLQTTIDSAAAGDTIKLGGNLTTDAIVTIDKSLTIDGAGYEITSSAAKAFEIHNAANTEITVNFVNVKITNTANKGRCVDTRNDYITVNIDADTVLKTTYTTSNTQPLTIGGTDTAGRVTVKVDGIIEAGNAGYGIISFVPADITVNGTVSGYGAIYMKQGSEGSAITVNGALNSINVHGGASNNFGAVALEANNISIKVTGSINAEATGGAEQSAFSLSTVPAVNASDEVVKIELTDSAEIGGDVVLGEVDTADVSISVAEENTTLISMINTQGAVDGVYVNTDGTVASVSNKGLVADPVALLNGTHYDDLQAAINAANGGTVYLLKNIETSGTGVAYTIKNAVTIDGGGHLITTLTNQKLFEIYNEGTAEMAVAFDNIELESGVSYGRLVDTRTDNIALTLGENSTLHTHGSGNTQPLTIGGAETEGVTVNVNGLITAGDSGYGIIAFVPTDITVGENGYVEGYGAIYMKEGTNGSKITVNGYLDAENVHSGESNSFGAIVLEDTDIEIKLNGMVWATATGDAMQSALTLGNVPEGGKVSVEISETAKFDGDIVLNFDADKVGITVAAGNTDVIAALSAEGEADGFDLPKNADGSYGTKAHNIVGYDKKGADCTTAGYEAYWHCEACGKYYSDANGTTEIAAPTEIPALGHTDNVILNGHEATCTEDGLTDGTKCSVCGETIVAQQVIPAKGHAAFSMVGEAATCTKDGTSDWTKCYTCGQVLEAPTVIKATGHTVANGKCTVCGDAATTQFVSPQTGDDNNIFLWIAIMAVAAIGCVAVVIVNKKKAGE